MGCGLRKLEDPDDSSPGKIFSTLKRPQVETKTDSAYEYVLLDFTLEASSNPEVTKISSVLDIASKVEEYYSKGYVVGAVHPIILPIGRRRNFPASHMYRVVLSRLKLSQKHAAPRGQRHPRLVIEECPLMYETLTNEVVKELLEKVNEAAKRGKKFVGFVTQHFPQPKACNGTSTDGSAELESTLGKRNKEHRRKNSDENYKNWNEGTLSGHSSESGIEEEIQGESSMLQDTDFHFGKEVSPVKPRKGDEVWFSVDLDCSDVEGLDNLTVYFGNCFVLFLHSRGVHLKIVNSQSTSAQEASQWLLGEAKPENEPIFGAQLYCGPTGYCQASTRDYLPKSLEGLFIYEEEGAGVPGSNRKGNDAIVVEQWTVIEGCEIKTDYGPLLHTLAEFGWLLTCVLPTPIVRHDRTIDLSFKLDQ
ncbi:raftlin-2 isoform x1 [Limosa lapponica baueri]|uniref:Raftlin-2 isoform x1 n=1 Tax=Limosa lapponica baueri TaxID=1758121 RepID=A0A2I0UQE5_LIMLA|nr:raftlin-2 isoform x1 [Limosa lapponica baueri]